jgi:predicted DNA-binding protein (UPF0251 family)
MSPRHNGVIRPVEYAMTLGEIAEKLGVSRERVRQIEQRALGKMRRALHGGDGARGIELRGLMQLADDLRMRREMRRDGDPE